MHLAILASIAATIVSASEDNFLEARDTVITTTAASSLVVVDWQGPWNCAKPWNWFTPQCRTRAVRWPPACPSGAPLGYPHAFVPWNPAHFKWPGECPPHPNRGGAKYPTGCTNNTPPHTNFTLSCPSVAAGQIKDGQIQCNSPYPAQDAMSGSTTAIIKSSFSIKNGGLYDQFGRGCEISSGNQLQCNALINGATAETGFAIDSSSNLIWQGENTWYGCNIGTDSSYGQILFTGTHENFTGSSAPTLDNNPNCIALRLGIVWA